MSEGFSNYRASNSRASGGVMRYVDWLTVGIYLLLVAAGVVSIYAASYDYDNASIWSFDEFSGKQVVWIGLALALGLVVLLVDARMYETYAYPIYVAMIALLVLTIFVAPDIKGSRSWLPITSTIRLQPAEFAKFATALALAKLFSTYGFRLQGVKNYAKAVCLFMLPVLLILAQKETGSALVYFALFFVLYREGMSGLVLFAALFAVVIFVVALKYAQGVVIGMPAGEFAVMIMIMAVMEGMLLVYVRHFDTARNVGLWFVGTGIVEGVLGLCGVAVPGRVFFGVVIGVAAVYCLFEMLRAPLPRRLLVTVATAVVAVGFLLSVNAVFTHMMPHQQKRILVALSIEDDPRNAGYNVNQSKIAIGSGGVAGKGFLKGTQTKLKYVPEQHTDFIFCTIGEEEGFVGTSAVVVLFLLLIMRVMAIAERQPGAFGRVYGYCVASYLIFHFCINIGMVIGLCPVIGIPLPLFSYGGSSLWGFTLLLFILLRLDAARNR